MTLEEAKRVYVAAGGPSEDLDSEGYEIREELTAVVAAKSDRAAGHIIDWWECWTPRQTATACARRVRTGMREFEAEQQDA